MWWRVGTCLWTLGLMACAEPAERPDFIETCAAPECKPGPGGQSGGGSSSTTGSTTGGGTETTTLSGDFWLLTDASFSIDRARAFSETAVVFSFDRNNSLISAQYDGNSFLLPGLAASENTTLLVVPDDDTGSALPTLLRLDTRQSSEMTLPLISADVLSEIYSSLNTLSVLDPDRAQVVYQVLDANGDPLAGVRLSVPEAEFVAYADGTSFSDVFEETDHTGLAIVGNVPAAEMPGSSINLTLSGALIETQVLTVVRGAANYEQFIAD